MEHQQAKSDGTRSRTGCLTCRIRKKKCDEQRPTCWTCLSRRLACYGFSEPVPDWISSKASWKQVRGSDQAKSLRRVVESQYRVSRKVEAHLGAFTLAILPLRILNEDIPPQAIGSAAPARNGISAELIKMPSISYLAAGVNIWQTCPESIWWDSKMQNLRPSPSSSDHPPESLFYACNSSSPASREGTRLLMIYLDVIHPITHTFYKLRTSVDRSWMLSRLVETESLFCSAISISACFEHSLTQSPSMDNIGISSKVLRLQSESLVKLQAEVDQFAIMSPTPVGDFVSAGIRLLGVIAHLETLEIFSMLQGQWEIHHQAAKRVLNHIEIGGRTYSKTSTSIIATMLSSLPEHDSRRRSLEFSILNYVWVDVLATSTFGGSHYHPCSFDYLPLLNAEILKPQDIMGCQGWVVATICKITRLEEWRRLQQSQTDDHSVQTKVWQERRRLGSELDIGIGKLLQAGICLHKRKDVHSSMQQDERDPIRQGEDRATQLGELQLENSICSGCDVLLVTVIWAYGAQVLLQVFTALDLPSQVGIDDTFINLCLERLEALPIRLVMRITWPYTIAGSMATSEPQQQRFRWIVGKTLQGAQAPGISWKGLVIMEECWRLRRIYGDRLITWREAMDSLKAKVILT